MTKLLATLLASAVLLTLTGCGQKIADQKTETGIDKNDVRSLSYDAFTNDYELSVEYRSTGAVVTLGIFKKADVPDLAQADFKKALTTSSAREGKLVHKIEKGTPVMVVITNSEMKTDVWLKIASK
jgi:predicted small lipoprotein YifL